MGNTMFMLSVLQPTIGLPELSNNNNQLAQPVMRCYAIIASTYCPRLTL